MKIRLILLGILSVALLSSCGFHLRGKVDLDPRLANVYVKGKDREIVRRLEDGFEFSGSTIAEDEASATAVVNIYKAQYKRTIKSTDLRGKATGYTLSYDLLFNVKDRAGRIILRSRPVKSSRSLNFSSAQVLEKSDEEEFLQEEMQRELAPRMLRQIATIGKKKKKTTSSSS